MHGALCLVILLQYGYDQLKNIPHNLNLEKLQISMREDTRNL